MSIFEAIGTIAVFIVVVGLISIGTTTIYDYWYHTRPVVKKMSEVIMTGKDAQGKDVKLTRIDAYDMMVIEAFKAKEVTK